MNHPGDDSHGLIEAVMADLPNLNSGKVIAVAQLRDHVYRVQLRNQAVVMKLFTPDRGHAAQREASGLRATAPVLGRRAPQLLGHGRLPDTHTPYLVLSEVPGATLRQAMASAALPEPEALVVLGSLLADLHQAEYVGFGSVASHQRLTNAGDFIHQLTAHRARLLDQHGHGHLAETLRATAETAAALAAKSDRSVLCHGDLHLDNVLVRQADDGTWDVSGVVDYESVVYAIPEYDLAKTLVVCSTFDPAHRRALLDAYHPHTVNTALLTDFCRYHTIDGWLWATIVEDRHHDLWNDRLQRILGADIW